MRRLMLLPAALAMTIACAAAPVRAADAKGCEGFLWPLATELAWMRAPESEKVASGASLAAVPADKAIEIGLEPVSKVTFPAPPTSTPKPDDAQTFGGVVTIAGIPAGHYQVTIGAHGWIDIVQNGAALEATGHTGAKDCDVLGKSVRFEIADGPFTIQVSGVRKEQIRVAIRPAAD
ncbi:MAG: hypothetical protein AB7S70_14800 [Hyphomicrobium sp.]|uniref:hypothetical protein n=1 Tax=Hyphomicrobium sp. TaxID=82 RepID=UPI003D114843